MKKFSRIKEIQLEEKFSWEKKVFLTFDVDWAEDFIIEPLIDLLEDREIPATWFITHDTPLLNRLSENCNFELGIHPNFNNLLNGSDANGKNPREVIQRLLDLVPEAVSVRSHSMCQSSELIELFNEFGLRYECNHFLPFRSGIDCRPWLHWNNMIKVPYFWEDDIEAMQPNKYDLTQPLSAKGLKVFDFHPIHVYLNTDVLSLYQKSRTSHRNLSLLHEFINTERRGTQNALRDLIAL